MITLRFLRSNETFYFDPPLPPAKEIQVVGYYGYDARKVAIFCDIVDPLSSYSNYESGEFGPSQLLALISSDEYQSVKVQRNKDPINSMNFSLKEVGKILRGIYFPFNLCLKIYH